MPSHPRRATGPRAWWLDAAVAIAAIAAAQALVFGGGSFLDRVGSTGPDRLGLDAALLLQRTAEGTDSMGSLAPLAVTLDGTVEGLYPGAAIDLALQVRNIARVPVLLDRLTITVGAPDRIGCPADVVLVGAPASPGRSSERLDVRIAPEGTMTLRVPVAMVTGAPSACQGATFPLAYVAEGRLP